LALLAGIDFFTVEVLTRRGLVTYYVLFFLDLDTRKVTAAGMIRHPDEEWMCIWLATPWMSSMALCLPVRFVLQDRHSKFCAPFRSVLYSSGVEPIRQPPPVQT
jgi:putative transposase